ncbi:ABC transporter permease [Microcoleus sp. FACHB-1515]|uniref:ABC transporter permease n=1 Tax=Cyanophyceae TaxID=3028117 RepID=UPI00168619FD|nr:ABC transporter permease [Microcoleus sp. FACHB-1515]MBD2088656.1 ABC transporter permease [Microcoleus sp. FACHB-1515]
MGIIFANIIAIYRKELQGYFASPFAYVIAGIFWVLSGFFFTLILLGPEGLIVGAAAQDQQGGGPPIDVPYQFLSIFLSVLGSIALFLLPMLSMGLYTEERKRGTLELLATSPVTNWAVALGKLLAVLTFFITMLLPFMAFEAFALSASSPPIQPTVFWLGHLGLILLAAAILSLGMFVSSLTDSTILAAVMTFAIVLLLWVIDQTANSIGGNFGAAIGHLTLVKHYTNFIQGIFSSSSLILFGSYVVLGLFLTAQAIEAFRFQRS